jgi:hypothetical protein
MTNPFSLDARKVSGNKSEISSDSGPSFSSVTDSGDVMKASVFGEGDAKRSGISRPDFGRWKN